MALGAAGYLTKPFEPAELLAQVNQLLALGGGS
jgi:DNA-binding response OmpR family regulator